MKLLHSSDWQIGMRAESVGAVGTKVRAERLESAKRVIELARTHQAEFVLLTGDLFENNAVDRLLARKVTTRGSAPATPRMRAGIVN